MQDDLATEATVERLVSGLEGQEQPRQVESFRPKTFSEYPGQTVVKANLAVYVEAAKKRDAVLDHVILHGPPGLGKTTMAHILANELGVNCQVTSGPSIEKPGDLAGLLAGLEKGCLLFIDEVHRLTIQVEEVLYSAMEDFTIDLIVGQGPTARSIVMDIQPFTLVGATTKLSKLSRPFLSRFGIQERLVYYSEEQLVEVLLRSASLMKVDLDQDAAMEIAQRARGTPRIANRLLRRSMDFSIVAGLARIDRATACTALLRLEIDGLGLDATDRAILTCIAKVYRGGPVGIETLAATIGEDRSTLEEVYEPYLVYKGYLRRGPRGRQLTPEGEAMIDRFNA
jgi:Holliday junction DNA helicase RuvB